MKKYKVTLGTLLLTSSVLIAAPTTTSVAMHNPTNATQNEYGDTQMLQDISLETKNFTVDEFWSKFSFNKNSASNTPKTYTVSTNANVKLTVELSFACKDGGLKEEGCSSQKPFLINENLLTNDEMQRDSEGASLPEGEYRIPFDSAGNYNSSNDDAFYALDIFRDGKYYEDPIQTGESTDKSQNFFEYLVGLFKDYFSKDIDTYTNGTLSPEQRNRYIANITFGAQKDYRLAKSEHISTNQINKANKHKNVSLLDYNSQIVEKTTGCNGLFLSYDPDSLTCKSINFFGLSNFMPFVNNTPEIKVKSDSVTEDTETTLLTLAGKLDSKNYVDAKTQIDATSGKKSVLGEIFKPVTFMASSMMRFWFGNSSKNTTEVVSAAFDFDTAMPLTFIETDGSVVKNFRHFLLMGIESIYGTEVESCRVKDKKGFFGWASSYETFTKGDGKFTKFDMEKGFFSSVFNDPSGYSELNFTEEKHRVPFLDWGNHDVVTVTSDDWLDWCKRNQGRQQKGLFSRIFDSFAKVGDFLLGNSSNGATYDEQLDKLLDKENYSVDKYKEKVHKGLILHLKNISTDLLTPATKGTTTKFKIMKTSKGTK